MKKLIDFFKKNLVFNELLFYISVVLMILFSIFKLIFKNNLFYIGSAFGLIGLIFYFIVNPEIFIELFSSKESKKNFYTVVKSILILILIISFFSVFGDKLPKIDLTSTKIYSLSPLTKEVLKKLDSELTIYYFITGSESSSALIESIEKLINAYEKRSKYIKLKKIDIRRDPIIAQKFSISSANSIVLVYKNRKKEINPWDLYEMQYDQQESSQMFIGEKILTSSIKFLMNEKPKKIYFVIGHEEYYRNDYNQNGISKFKEMLENLGHVTEDITLIEKGKIPEDCDLLVIAAPKKNYTETEIKIIDEFINRGGKFFLFDRYYSEGNISNIVYHIYNKFKVERLKGVLIDKDKFYNEFKEIAPVIRLNYHKTTENVQALNLPVLSLFSIPLKVDFTKDYNDFKIYSIADTYETTFNAIWDEKKKDISVDDLKFENKSGQYKGSRPIVLIIEKKNVPQSSETTNTNDENNKNNNVNQANKSSPNKSTENNQKSTNENNFVPQGVIFSSVLIENWLAELPIGNFNLVENLVNFTVGDIELVDIGGKLIKDPKIVMNNNQRNIFTFFILIFVPIILPLLYVLFIIVIPKLRIKYFSQKKE
ncbi:MAG: GldG family protein [Spirochaetes bacterium]|nr:GldG family protein [Spirochaetota bacterium]